MKSYTNDEKDIFRDAINKYQESGEEKRLSEKYRQRSFLERSKWWRLVASFASYIPNVVSILTGFYFFYLITLIFIPIWWVALTMSLIPIVVWEYFKREAATNYLFQRIGRNNVAARSLIILIVISIGSIIYSYNGGKQVLEDFTYQPTLLNVDSVKNIYDTEIAELKEQRKGFNNVDGVTNWDLRHEAAAVDAQVLATTNLKHEKTAETEKTNAERLETAGVSTNIKAEWFGIGSGLCDVLLYILLGFIEYVDKRRRSEINSAKTEVGDSKTETKHKTNGTKINGTGVNGTPKATISKPLQTARTVAKSLRIDSKLTNGTETNGNGKICLNCPEDISHKKGTAKYCSDKCRREHWTVTNGRDLKMKKSKVG